MRVFTTISPGEKNIRNDLKPGGFSLVELLVAIGIVALLASIILTAIPILRERGKQASSLNNMRQIGLAFFGYATDHDLDLPRRATDGEKWPLLLNEYMHEEKVFADPGDSRNFLKRNIDALNNNSRNYTSYLMNGFNDLGSVDGASPTLKLNSLPEPSKTALLGIKRWDINDFYFDLAYNEQSFINQTLYGQGSHYLFADGSVRYIARTDYDVRMWMVNQDFTAP